MPSDCTLLSLLGHEDLSTSVQSLDLTDLRSMAMTFDRLLTSFSPFTIFQRTWLGENESYGAFCRLNIVMGIDGR